MKKLLTLLLIISFIACSDDDDERRTLKGSKWKYEFINDEHTQIEVHLLEFTTDSDCIWTVATRSQVEGEDELNSGNNPSVNSYERTYTLYGSKLLIKNEANESEELAGIVNLKENIIIFPSKIFKREYN